MKEENEEENGTCMFSMAIFSSNERLQVTGPAILLSWIQSPFGWPGA
jgi:hypothetical protein